MALTTQSPITVNNLRKMVIFQKHESAKLQLLMWKLHFYHCSCSAAHNNGINVFTINTSATIQLFKSKFNSCDSYNLSSWIPCVCLGVEEQGCQEQPSQKSNYYFQLQRGTTKCLIITNKYIYHKI